MSSAKGVKRTLTYSSTVLQYLPRRRTATRNKVHLTCCDTLEKTRKSSGLPRVSGRRYPRASEPNLPSTAVFPLTAHILLCLQESVPFNVLGLYVSLFRQLSRTTLWSLSLVLRYAHNSDAGAPRDGLRTLLLVANVLARATLVWRMLSSLLPLAS